MTDTVNTIPIVLAATAVMTFLTTILWNVYNKASATQKEDIKIINSLLESEIKKLNEKIDVNTAHCVNKQRDLQMNVDQNRDNIQQVRAELSQAIMDHKVETINRQDANMLMEEKIKPIRESVEEIKNDTRATNNVLTKVLQSLGRIEGGMGISAKRSEDYL